MSSPSAPPPDSTLTLITVSYQTAPDVMRMVESLRAHPPAIPWHLMIIDNASPDGSGTALAAAYAGAADVTVRLSEENLGFGKANNLIARELTSPYIGFLNPDCVVDAEPFTAMVAYLESHADIGVAGCVFYALDGSPQSSPRRFPDPAAGLGGRNSPIRKLWPNNPWSRRYLMEDGPLDQPRLCDWVAGTVMVVRRQEFLHLGGFDPDYFLYWEDADLCWRYRHELGLQTIYLPVGHIRHEAGAAAATAKPFSIRHFNRGARILVKKRLYPFPLHPVRLFALLALSIREAIMLARAARSR